MKNPQFGPDFVKFITVVKSGNFRFYDREFVKRKRDLVNFSPCVMPEL